MQRPQRETVTLEYILITEELSRRNPREANLLAENRALQALARQLVNQPQTMLQHLVDIALNLCSAGTAGVSLLEMTSNGEEIFRWNVLAGALTQYVSGTIPRNFSPCGVCLDRGTPQLYAYPERYFTDLQAANTPIVEGLVLPLIADNQALGTIWILSHDEQRHFDSEDVRIMTSLADLAAAALLLNQRQTQELLAKNAQLEVEAAERQRAEELARESEAYFRAMMENLPGGAVFVVDRNLHYLLAEGEALHSAGFTSADFVGKTIFEVLSPELAANYEVNYRRALAGEPFEQEHEAHDRSFISRGTPLRSADGEVYAVVVVSYDITERKLAEESLHKSQEQQTFLLKLSDALRPVVDPVDIQQTVTRTAMNYFGADRCYYCEIEDGNAIIRRDAVREDLPTVAGVYPLSRFAILQAVIEAGHPFVVQDVHTTDTVDDDLRQLCIQLQVISYINVPVIKNGKPVGVLSLVQSTPRDWTDLEVELAIETADRTWASVERARAEANLRESEIQLFREQSAREQERQRAETLAELDRAKTLFFSNISHEFRTPLTLLLASLQDALSDSANPLPLAQRDRLELAQRNAVRLLKLVNTLLDFSRIEAGRMEAVYEPTDLARFTTELASVFRSAIERAGLRLIVDCPAISEPVYVDREMWEKIVLNLLSNAFKFTLEGEIAVRLHLVDEYVKLQVKDTGTGIAPEELPRLFERFYQIRGVQARTHEGSGIGLALVQELIKLHGGTVEVTSSLGVGSCFTVTIPLGTAHLQTDRIQATRTLASTALGAAPYVQEAERWIGEEGTRDWGLGTRGQGDKGTRRISNPQSPIPNPQSPVPHVLIVDDNADMRDYLTSILSEYVEVEAVADGAAAIAAVNQRVPDLVLSDVMMPGLDGFELLQALRADARTKEVPIILLSARAGEESVIEGLQAGADDYLIKPFSATELVTRVNAYLQMAQLRSEALRSERTINRRKDEILSTVSHELNTPLVAILGWTRLLRSSPPSSAMLWKALESIERNATLQAKLVQDLLDISRITAGKIHLNLEPVALQGVIDQAIATVRQCETKDIHLDCQLAAAPTIVQGDPERLQQIILNLLTNAVKFTPTGGRIAVSLQTDENQADIIVSDTGCGIDSDFLPYIFDTFRQADGVKKGLGLGLAIARSLVELHGGTIHAQSPGVGQGATFIVKLPLGTSK
ncbi:multi-sensor signal transduction histidine kinase (plasmid) [Nostoc carneum NIES-2107]|nr:multi-sensor signal transduction histidine kinase [Nostoc carneum NIES-2107]